MGSHSLLQKIFPIQGLNHVSHITGRFFTIWTARDINELLWLLLLNWNKMIPLECWVPKLLSGLFDLEPYNLDKFTYEKEPGSKFIQFFLYPKIRAWFTIALMKLKPQHSLPASSRQLRVAGSFRVFWWGEEPGNNQNAFHLSISGKISQEKGSDL